MHFKHFLSVVRRAEDRGHFRLIKDKFDLGCTHGIVEPHSRHIVMHAGEQRLCPFRTILRPNTYEAPHSAFSFNLWRQLERHHAICQVLHILIHLSVRLPLVVTEKWRTSLIRSNLWPRAEEWFISAIGHMVLETRQKCLLTFLQEWLRAEVIIVFGLYLVVNELTTVALLSFFILTPLSVLSIANNTISLDWICLDHVLLIYLFRYLYTICCLLIRELCA